MAMNILLTGGAGYIGSHTAYALKQVGFTPVVLDNLSQGHLWAVKFGPFIKGDMGDEATVRALCAEYKPAALIHFAAFIDVGESVVKPAKYMENNFYKAARLLDVALSCGIKQTVFSSTAAVYGTPQNSVLLREDHPLKPINPYGESKLAAENYLRSLGSKGMRSVTLRYFNAAGAAESSVGIGEAHKPESHLIPNVLLAGLGQKEKVKIFGTDYPTPDGTAVRDYIHVCDLAEAHVASLRYLLADGATEVCNLGTGRGSSVKEVITTAERIMRLEIPKSYESRRSGDPTFLVADATVAKQKLRWQLLYSLEQIIESALKWHRTIQYMEAVKVG